VEASHTEPSELEGNGSRLVASMKFFPAQAGALQHYGQKSCHEQITITPSDN
jgi:hypothetical protein